MDSSPDLTLAILLSNVDAESLVSDEIKPGITPDSIFWILDRTIEKIQLGLAFNAAKKAILRPLNKEKTELESDLKEKINKLGIGPMGLGGKTSALAVNIEKMGCHTASLPVAVNIQCWAARRAVGEIYNNKYNILSH